MNVTLHQFTITDFRGIRLFSYDFQGMNATVLGDNAVGKTTLADAFFWLITGKNLEGMARFPIKPFDKEGIAPDDIECVVEGIVFFDDEEVSLKKIYKAKTQHQKGDPTKTSVVNINICYWNDVDVSTKIFEARIADRIPTDVFSIITNPLWFPTQPWRKQREMLLNMTGDISDVDIVLEYPDLADLVKELEKYTIVEITAQTRKGINQGKTDKKGIPDQIKGARMMLANVEGIDVPALEEEKQGLVDALTDLRKESGRISDAKNDSNKKKFDLSKKMIANNKKVDAAKYTLSVEVTQGVRKAQKAVQDIVYQIEDAKRDKSRFEHVTPRMETNILDLTAKIKGKADDFKAHTKAVFEPDENATVCPTCNREFEEDAKNTIIEDLNNLWIGKRDRTLAKIKIEGEDLVAKRKKARTDLNKVKADIKKIDDTFKGLEDKLILAKETSKKAASIKAPTTSDEIKKIEAENESLGKQLKAQSTAIAPDDSSLLTIISDNMHRQQEIDSMIKTVSSNKRVEDKVNELRDEETELGVIIADLEKKDILCSLYSRAYSELLEGKVNDLFDTVTFKMFTLQVNGGLDETCVALIDGVPFDTANSAAKITTGLEIINQISSYYGITAPIFLDNRESILHLEKPNMQMICLFAAIVPVLETLQGVEEEIFIAKWKEDIAREIRNTRGEVIGL